MTGGDNVLSVLVAEKNAEFRQKISNLLADSYKVYEADNGIEAIEISERENISIYLINCKMPFISEKDFLNRFANVTIQPLLLYGTLEELNLMNVYPFIHFFEYTEDLKTIRKMVDLMKFHHYGTSTDARYFRYLGLEIDYFLKKVKLDQTEIKLTPKEFDLLVFLLTRTGEHFSRETLLEKVWGYEFLGDSRTIDTHIKSLRNKLGPYRNIIITIWGKGYKIELPDRI